MKQLSSSIKVMEPENHSKNGASPKSLMSRRNVLIKVFTFFIIVISALFMTNCGGSSEKLVAISLPDGTKMTFPDAQQGEIGIIDGTIVNFNKSIFIIPFIGGRIDFIDSAVKPVNERDEERLHSFFAKAGHKSDTEANLWLSNSMITLFQTDEFFIAFVFTRDWKNVVRNVIKNNGKIEKLKKYEIESMKAE